MPLSHSLDGFRNLYNLVYWLRVGFRLNFLLGALILILLPIEIWELLQLPQNIPIFEDDRVRLSGIVSLVALTNILVRLTLTIFFLRWVYLANKNTRILTAGEMRFSPGWAVGWFFIPFFNIILPVQVLSEIYSKSAPASLPDANPEGNTRTIIDAWWICSVLVKPIEMLASKIHGPFMKPALPENIIRGNLIFMVSMGFLLAAIYFTFKVVTEIYERQEDKAKEIAAAPMSAEPVREKRGEAVDKLLF